MNDILKYTIVGIGSAIVSGVTTFFITKKVMEDKAEEKIQKEINDFKKTYIKKTPVSELKKENPDLVTQIKEEKEQILEELKDDEDILEHNYRHPIRKDINIQASPSEDKDALYPRELDTNEGKEEIDDFTEEDDFFDTDEDDKDIMSDEEEEDMMETKLDDVNEDQAEPYVITEEEFDQQEGNEKESLLYYEEDDTLCDEEANDIIYDINDAIGDSFINHFGDMSTDPTVVYIRNDKRAIDYMVQLVHSSYKHMNSL